MDNLDLLEEYIGVWPNLQKGQVIRGHMKGYREIYWFAVEIADLWILVTLLIGNRGGTKEWVVVVNPHRRVLADRLLANYMSEGSDWSFINLSVFRDAKRQGRDPAPLYAPALNQLLEDVTDGDPEKRSYWKNRFTSLQRPSGATFPQFLRGGSPGAGRPG